jgi:hypothetical protein
VNTSTAHACGGSTPLGGHVFIQSPLYLLVKTFDEDASAKEEAGAPGKVKTIFGRLCAGLQSRRTGTALTTGQSTRNEQPVQEAMPVGFPLGLHLIKTHGKGKLGYYSAQTLKYEESSMKQHRKELLKSRWKQEWGASPRVSNIKVVHSALPRTYS